MSEPPSIDERLKKTRATIESTKLAQRETVRSILGWFGALRRGSVILADIERALARHGLQTEPSLSEPWIDAEVEISIAPNDTVESPYDALIARLGHLEAANQPPSSVKRDQPLEVAAAIMVRNDFSQLPVMANEYQLNGFVSWRTIGEARALGKTPTFVRDCMATGVQLLEPQIPLTNAIDAIIQHEFVMVKGPDGRISGPVTTTDLSAQYHALAQPFLLIGQIESAIRRVLDAYAPQPVLEAAKHGPDARQIERPEDLTFSEYKNALGHPDVWPKLRLKLCRSEFLRLLEDVRSARNDVMHFHPDDNSDEAIRTLRNAARMLEMVADAVVARSPIR